MEILEADTDRLAAMFRALAHPARIEIVRSLIAEGDRQCRDLTQELALAQSTVSEHLRVLKEAGLVEQCGPGGRAGYCINKVALVWLKQAMVAL
jgi:DNA-binding transcriptional ArsR family regulator